MSLQRVCLVEEQSLRRTFHNAIPESIQGSYDCSLLLVGLFVGIRGNHDTIVAVMNPLKVSIELELGATPEQEAGINANTPAGVAAARRLIKKANAVALVHSLVDEDTLLPQGDTGEHLHIHDICDAILLTYCWFRWTRETLDFAGNPV
ncbi:hypothetical protein HDU99_004134 [Rhizoclosmatium hyalinum]|nr:hypothetical protein HDU99_004134 [Rhizoclosmatium hyalinum]